MKDSTKKLLDQLRELTAGMDLPSFRKEDPKWLVKNMAVRNAEHPNFSKASELVKELVKMGLCVLITLLLMSGPGHALTAYPDYSYTPYIIVDCSKCCDCKDKASAPAIVKKAYKYAAKNKVAAKKKIVAAKAVKHAVKKSCPDCPPCPPQKIHQPKQIVREKESAKKGWWIFGPVTEEDLYTSVPGHSHDSNASRGSSVASNSSGSGSGQSSGVGVSGEGSGGGSSPGGGSNGHSGGCSSGGHSGGHGHHGHGGHHGGSHGHGSHGCK